jgi:peptidoglycan hydrolase-like protein with peptidoglycan-binding domain
MSVSIRVEDIHDGSMVIRVQTQLKRAGIDPAPDNGTFGAPTEAAVRQFQTTRRLPVTGIVDQRTWTALGLKGAVPHPVIID